MIPSIRSASVQTNLAARVGLVLGEAGLEGGVPMAAHAGLAAQGLDFETGVVGERGVVGALVGEPGLGDRVLEIGIVSLDQGELLGISQELVRHHELDLGIGRKQGPELLELVAVEGRKQDLVGETHVSQR
jgi:hypothetical protein